jgi:hypothetical protein
MNPSNENNALRKPLAGQPDDKQNKPAPDPLIRDGKASEDDPGKETDPVRINREDAQNKIPPDRDPDDPVSQ